MIALSIASAILLLVGIYVTVVTGSAFVCFSALEGKTAWGLFAGVIGGLVIIWLAIHIAPFTFHIGLAQ